MHFEPGKIYHVFNQGNNKQSIFFEKENYDFFLSKMKKHVLPYSDIICYCLMPNHFHWLIRPNRFAIQPSKSINPTKLISINDNIENKLRFQNKLNQQIGVLLSSYTKAINKRFSRSGSLFRGKTKAKNGLPEGVVTVEDKDDYLLFNPGNPYAQICFEYIHNNPVKAGLVNKPSDWIYSSARDYLDLRKDTICNLELGRNL